MRLTEDLLTFDAAPVAAPVNQEWYNRIVSKRVEQRRLLLPWTPCPPEQLHKFASKRFVRDIPISCNLLAPLDIEITEATPRRLLKRIAAAEWSAERVLRAFIRRAAIAQGLTNPISEVMFDYGISRAKALDGHLGSTGRIVGPLHGLPLSIKDLFDVRGYDSTRGYAAFIAKPAKSTTILIQKLEEAGAVLFCKTNVPQTLSSGECVNYVFGRTSSPFNTALSAGGSSGGEGSLVSLGGSPLGIGTDIAGSVRTPANFCGIYGLTPTRGRLPYAHGSGMDGIAAVHGPLCRSVDGLELYVRALLETEPWNWDHATIRIPWREDEYREGLGCNGPLAFGFMSHDGVVRPHPPIVRCIDEVKTKLRAAGHVVVDFPSIKVSEMQEVLFGMLASDGSESVREIIRVLDEPLIKEIEIWEKADALSAAEYFELNKKKDVLRQEWMQAWMSTTTKTPTGRPIDALIMPSGGHVAPPHGSMTYFMYEAISNVLDLPCATIPVGFVDEKLDTNSAEGAPLSKADEENQAKYKVEAYSNAPVALQVMGQKHCEEKILGVLKSIDKALGRPPDYQA